MAAPRTKPSVMLTPKDRAWQGVPRNVEQEPEFLEQAGVSRFASASARTGRRPGWVASVQRARTRRWVGPSGPGALWRRQTGSPTSRAVGPGPVELARSRYRRWGYTTAATRGLSIADERIARQRYPSSDVLSSEQKEAEFMSSSGEARESLLLGHHFLPTMDGGTLGLLGWRTFAQRGSPVRPGAKWSADGVAARGESCRTERP